MDGMGGMDGMDRTFEVKQKEWKGKKLPNKKKVGEYVTLSIGTMGIKVMDGMMPIDTILMQNLVSWESVDTNKFRISIKNPKGGSKPKTIDFGTTSTEQGPEICEVMLEFAKKLAEERKRQQKAEKAAKKLAAENKETAKQEGGGGGGQTFEVQQNFYKKHSSGPKKGQKIPVELRLELSNSAVVLWDGYTQVDEILIQDLSSWETVSEDVFGLVVKPAKQGGSSREIEFGTPQAREITEMLLGFAKDLAVARKQQKIERKRKEKEAAAAAKLAEKLAPKLIAQGKLGEALTTQYLDTFKGWRDENLQDGTGWECFDHASMAPDQSAMATIDDVLAEESKRVQAEEPTVLGVLSMAKAGLPELGGITETFEKLAWSRPASDKDTIMTPTELTLLTEAVVDADKASSVGEPEGAEKFVETSALMLITAIGGNEEARKASQEGGGVPLVLGWLDRYSDNPSVCRAATTLLTVLLRGDGAKQLNEDDFAGLSQLVDIIDRAKPSDDERQKLEESDANITLYHNPLLMPTVDIVEKLLLCAYLSLKTGAGARVKAMELGLVTKVFHMVDVVQSAMLYTRLICGVLNVLLEPPDMTDQEDDPLAAFEEMEEEDLEGRLGVMMEANLLQVLVTALQHNIPDFAIAGTSALLMRILLSKDHKSEAATELADSSAIFVDVLARWGARKARNVMPFAVALTIVAVYHLAESPLKDDENYDMELQAASERKESLVEMEALQAVLANMKVHRKELAVQQAGYLAIHAMTDGLSDDVLEMLPEYMGIKEDKGEADEEQEEEEEGMEPEPEPEGDEEALPEGTMSYKIIRKAAVREAFELDSEQIAILETGDVIEVHEHRRNENNQVRIRTGPIWDPPADSESDEKVEGWTSITSRDGNKLMVPVQGDGGGDKPEEEVDVLMLKAVELMDQMFASLKQFPEDATLAEAVMYAAKSFLKEADIFKSAVGSGMAMKQIVWAAKRHKTIPGMAENTFVTIAALVKNKKQNQKKFRAAGGIAVVCALLEEHQGNVKVCREGLTCLAGLVKQPATANALNENGALEIVDSVMKQHRGELTSGDGLTVRNKLQKAEKSTPRKGATPRGRRASISIFGAAPSPRKTVSSDDAEEAKEDDEESKAMKELEEMMSAQTYDVRISHIKGKKKGTMQVGDMGITFYDENQMPLDSILYQVLRSWNSRPKKDITLVITTGDGEKEIVVKTPDGEDIAKQMEDKAKALAVMHKLKRKEEKAKKKAAKEAAAKAETLEELEEEEQEEEEIEIEDDAEGGMFGVAQSHLDAPGTVKMHVLDEKLTFTRHDAEGLDAPLSDVPYDAIKSIDASGDSLQLVCVVGDGQPDMEISLGTQAAAAIKEMVEPKKAAMDAAIAAEEAEAGPEPEAEDEEEEEEEEDDDDDDEEEDEGDEVLKELYTVDQIHFRGTRSVNLEVTKKGLIITDEGKQTGHYRYKNLESWYNVRGEGLHVLVEQGSGLVSDFIFNTLEGHSICSLLETYASELAAEALAYLAPGTEREVEGDESTEAKPAEEATPADGKPGDGKTVSPEFMKKVQAMSNKLKVAQQQNAQYLDQIEEMKTEHENALDDLRNTLTEQNNAMKSSYAEQFKTLTEGGDVDAALKKALDEANAKYETDMKAKDAKYEADMKKAEEVAAADKAKVQQELDDMKSSGAAGETTQTQIEMQKRDQMMKKLGEKLKKTMESEKKAKKMVAAARSKMQEQMVTVKKQMAEKDKRIVELTKGGVQAASAAETSSAKEDTVSAANLKASEEALASAKEDFERDLAAKDEELAIVKATIDAMKKKGGKGGGDKVLLTQLQTENASLKSSKVKLEAMVEKLKKQGAMAMDKLKSAMAEGKKSQTEMEAMKKQRQKETALVQRAMGELKNLRAQIAEKDKKIAALEAKQKKMMVAVQGLKDKQAKDVEMIKTKNAQAVKEERAKVITELVKPVRAELEEAQKKLKIAEAKAAATDVQDKVDAMAESVAEMKTSEAQMRNSMVTLRKEVVADIPKVVNACAFTVDAIMQKYLKECAMRRKLYNELQELKGNIRVYCRARPIIKMEMDQGLTDIVVPGVEGAMELKDPETGQKKANEFDRFFAPGTSQEKVYEETNPLVQSVCDGYNVCIFAYGQTGSGKTFTMMGSPTEPGVNMRALNELFRLQAKNKGSIDYSIKMAFLEIYCEVINDLLISHDKRTKLEIKQRSKGEGGGVHIPGLTQQDVTSVADVMKVMELGTKNRAASATKMNAESSRSHCVLAVEVHGENQNTGETVYGKLNMIDLAGSEKLKRSGVSGQAQKEAISINASLSALGDVIAGLGGPKGNHVPFRNSKLTHLLSDSLSGQSKCLMFLNISPASSNHAETTNSLLFGQRCRKVELGQAKKNKGGKAKKKAAELD